QQLRVEREAHIAEKSKLEARIQELQAAQAAAEQQVRQLSEALSEMTKRQEGAEQDAQATGKRRTELGAELAKTRQAQEQLRQELEGAQQQLRVEREAHIAEKSKLEARTRVLEALTNELAAARLAVEQESLQRRTLAVQVAEAERARAQL